MSSRVMA